MPACLPLNDGARYTGKYAHAASAQNGILVRNGDKKPSPSQGNQETRPCPELGPEAIVSMGLITILTVLLPYFSPVSFL